MIALVPRCASARLMSLDRSGPVAMRWMIERIRSLGSVGKVSVLMSRSIRRFKNTNDRLNRSRIDRVEQAADEGLPGLRQGQIHAEVAALGDPHAGVAARIDGGKRRQVHVDVEGQSVIGAAVPDAQAERGDLGAA